MEVKWRKRDVDLAEPPATDVNFDFSCTPSGLHLDLHLPSEYKATKPLDSFRHFHLTAIRLTAPYRL